MREQASIGAYLQGLLSPGVALWQGALSSARRSRPGRRGAGRPSKFNRYRNQLEAMLQDGASKAAMKRETGLAYNTVKKYVERIKS